MSSESTTYLSDIENTTTFQKIPIEVSGLPLPLSLLKIYNFLQILQYIFKFLNISDRRIAHCVCKLWDDILSDTLFTRNEVLKFNGCVLGDALTEPTRTFLHTVREFHHVEIGKVKIAWQNNQCRAFLASIGRVTKHLTISFGYPFLSDLISGLGDDYERCMLNIMFDSFPCLEELVLTQIGLNSFLKYTNRPKKMLKRLHVAIAGNFLATEYNKRLEDFDVISSTRIRILHGTPGGSRKLFDVCKDLPVWRDSDHEWIFAENFNIRSGRDLELRDCTRAKILIPISPVQTLLELTNLKVSPRLLLTSSKTVFCRNFT